MEISTIKKYFNYDPKTGELFYSSKSPINKGKRITRKYVTLNKEKISCTKIMYAIMNSKFPEFMLGFTDGDNKNWKWSNIEPASKSISRRQKESNSKAKTIGRICSKYFGESMDMFLLRGFTS